MQFGNGAGITTLCLLTGVSKVDDIENSEGLKKPTFYSKSLSGL
jgi:ribonucleotide monophosphatase NagD (HAD superfamily)